MSYSKIKNRFANQFKLGFAIGLGLFAGAIFAVAITGTVNTFSNGETLDATKMNANFQSLKAAIEGIPTQKSWRLIYENDVTATTGSIVATGLDGDSDVEYMIFTKFVGASAGAGDFQIELNGDTANGNYIAQNINVYQTGAAAGALGNPGSGAGLVLSSTGGTTLTAGTIFISKALLFAKSGTRRVGIFETGKTLSTSESLVFSGIHWWGNTTSNITTMRFLYTNGNGIGAGSRIEVWAKR